jgi:glycerol uptake facilitator-like aquaporin
MSVETAAPAGRRLRVRNNPVVTAVDWLLGRRAGTGITAARLGAYTVAQVLGGIAGALLANVMFDRPALEIAKERVSAGHLVGEVVATAATADQAIASQDRRQTLTTD